MTKTEAAAREAARHCMCLETRRIARRVTRAYDEALRPHGLRITQFTILGAATLSRGAATITELADALDMERSTLSRNLNLLEETGWIRRDPAKGRRARPVSITPEGARMFRAAMPAWREAQRSLRRALGADGSRALRAARAHVTPT
jgi:DNA-binding MarR family transcriptional regulator